MTPYTPSPPSPVAPAVDALTTILAALERLNTGSADGNAFHTAIRRKGMEVVEALNDAYATRRPTGPAEGKPVLNSAWAGLTGWQAY